MPHAQLQERIMERSDPNADHDRWIQAMIAKGKDPSVKILGAQQFLRSMHPHPELLWRPSAAEQA